MSTSPEPQPPVDGPVDGPIDTVVRRARVPGHDGAVDIALAGGRIRSVGVPVAAGPAEVDAGDRLVVAGLVDTHLHLDKALTADRCSWSGGTVADAMAETARMKAEFTADDVADRAGRVLAGCVSHGTTRVRTHVELDPTVGRRGLDGVLRAAREWAWAVDVEVCVFAQDGLTGSPETGRLLAEALGEAREQGRRAVVGGAPYADDDPAGQLDHVFGLAAEHDADVDLHLDLFDGTAEGALIGTLCDLTERTGLGGRVTAGHGTAWSFLEPRRRTAVLDRCAGTGVGVVVLPSTDLFLTGRETGAGIPRGVVVLDRLVERDAAAAVATNNVRNAFTPYGDGSLVRMANLYANLTHQASPEQLAACLDLVGDRAARVLGATAGVVAGAPADLVCLDAPDPATAVAAVAGVRWVLRGGRRTVTGAAAELHPPV
ncbi:amidohydrolase family protein [Pseudonocardia spirodelae]|uniref:Amidohydrolase family protein n=1 Tax=Pseudonocardia spirodelae TaxID=3133431 RepID=A0ABU8T4K1_9PSEU